MIDEKDILFVTTTLYSKWLTYSRTLIKKHFPESEHLIIDGTKNWPYAWFYWIEKAKSKTQKWVVHIDEDCFLTDKSELLKLIQKMEVEDYSISAIADGYCHYRGANPVAVNSFFMIANREHVCSLDVDYSTLNFWHVPEGWRNSYGIIWNEKYNQDFTYPHRIMGGSNYKYEQEPYYMILWMLKDKGRKFYYLFPHFDEHLKSTNPRIDESSNDIAIHMWYTRQWNSPMDVWGLPNNERYNRVEKILAEFQLDKL